MIADTNQEKISDCRHSVFELTEEALDAMRNHKERHAVDCLNAASKYAEIAAELREKTPEHPQTEITL